MTENPRIEELRRRIQKDPASIAFAQLAEEYRRAGRYEDAVRVCRAGLERHPNYLSARVTLGRTLIELEQHDEAQVELEYVLRAAPENLAAIRGLADIHQRRGELGDALKQYRAALGIARHDPDLEQSIEELARQVEAPPEPASRPHLVAVAPPDAEPAAAEESPQAFRIETSGGVELPGGTPVREDGAEVSSDAAAPAAAHLDRAADDLSRALEALDSLSLNLPTPDPLTGDATQLHDVSSAAAEPSASEWDLGALDLSWPAGSSESQLGTSPAAALAPVGPAEAAPEPSPAPDPVLGELEFWLEAILKDREERARRERGPA